MYEFHGDKQRYFDMTLRVTREHILPFLQEKWEFPPDMRVLEIGCGEAGVLKAFTEKGYTCMGIELEESRLVSAREFMAAELEKGLVSFLNKDIYDVDVKADCGDLFDLVILKDVIEHIPEQEKFMPQLHKFLKPGGVVFFAFPPWYMPYGGHQQVLHGKVASRLPYYHLLPGKLYDWALRALGTSPAAVETMKFIKSTGISVERFKRLCRQNSLGILHQRHYLFNPIYEHKFGIRPRRQAGLITRIPFLRNFVTMGVYFLVQGPRPD
jgi:SAM-dependent methyltransferase